MHAIASGAVKKPGLSRAKAEEYVAGQTLKGLPEHVPGRQRKMRKKVKKRGKKN